MKKLIFYTLFITSATWPLANGAVSDAVWKAIAEQFANDEKDGQTENLDLVIQAYRNIANDRTAKAATLATSAIGKKYPAELAKITSSERYPAMDKAKIKAELEKLPTTYGSLFSGAGVTVSVK